MAIVTEPLEHTFVVTEGEIETERSTNEIADELVDSVKEDYTSEFERAISEYRLEIGHFSPKIERFLKEKNWMTPTMEVLGGQRQLLY